jgi:hypothetical protein
MPKLRKAMVIPSLLYAYETRAPRTGQMELKQLRRDSRDGLQVSHVCFLDEVNSHKKCGERSIRGASELYNAWYGSHMSRIPDNRSAATEWELDKEKLCT